jgi:putative transposase
VSAGITERGQQVTTEQEADERRRLERAREIALFRYSLVQELVSPGLTAAERGRRARLMAAVEHPGPGGAQVRVSYQTIGRWKRAYLRGGFEALVPVPRQATPRTPEEVLELAAALRRENPARTAAQVQRILRATSGWSPSDRTLQRLFVRLELDRAAGSDGPQPAFGRFEASRPNELWTGDALHGPAVGGRKAYLFAFIDDHSRAVMGARWAFHEDVVRLAAALRPALAARGVPESAYVDNGSAFVDAWLLRACAVLGIRLVHSRPGKPQGRGKIERFFRTVRGQFLVELAGREIGDGSPASGIAELNRLFGAWLAASYHNAVHSETGQPPLARWAAGIPAPLPLPTPEQLREAFLWSERRAVKKTATVSLHGNLYQVDPSLVGLTVELVFDPFDLTSIQVRRKGKPAGTAVPFVIGRHRHAKTRSADQEPRQEPEPTGIDYLRILDQVHGRDLAAQINYAALIGDNHDAHGAGNDGSSGADGAGDTDGAGGAGKRDGGQEDGRG